MKLRVLRRRDRRLREETKRFRRQQRDWHRRWEIAARAREGCPALACWTSLEALKREGNIRDLLGWMRYRGRDFPVALAKLRDVEPRATPPECQASP